jgi:hypothetical protein
MLLPRSKGSIGLTEGRGLKLGIGLPINPLSDSDAAMAAYLSAGDPLELVSIIDEDSLPCIERTWGLEDLGSADLVDVCAEAWLKLASLIQSVVKEVGGPDLAIDLACRHNLDGIRIRVYDRGELKKGQIRGSRLR